MAVEIEISSIAELERTLKALSSEQARKAVYVAAKDAATSARKVGTQKIGKTYTMKARDMKAAAQIRPIPDGVVIDIKGPPEGIKKYKAAERKYGIFASIKKGRGIRVPRSFATRNGVFLSRAGKERYPLEGLYGPSVPQLYGNPEIMESMEKQGAEVFEERLEHEIERRIGK